MHGKSDMQLEQVKYNMYAIRWIYKKWGFRREIATVSQQDMQFLITWMITKLTTSKALFILEQVQWKTRPGQAFDSIITQPICGKNVNSEIVVSINNGE